MSDLWKIHSSRTQNVTINKWLTMVSIPTFKMGGLRSAYRIFKIPHTKSNASCKCLLADGLLVTPLAIHNLIYKWNLVAMASVGSVRAPNGSFAWVLYGTESQIHLTGHNTLTGGHSDLSTFQAEACGCLGALYALKAILTTFPPPHHTRYSHR